MAVQYAFATEAIKQTKRVGATETTTENAGNCGKLNANQRIVCPTPMAEFVFRVAWLKTKWN